jgi:hypothetical protein
MMVFYHITGVKCVKGCLKITLEAGVVVDVMLQFPGLYTCLTSIVSIVFMWTYLKTKVYASTTDPREEL